MVLNDRAAIKLEGNILAFQDKDYIGPNFVSFIAWGLVFGAIAAVIITTIMIEIVGSRVTSAQGYDLLILCALLMGFSISWSGLSFLRLPRWRKRQITFEEDGFVQEHFKVLYSSITGFEYGSSKQFANESFDAESGTTDTRYDVWVWVNHHKRFVVSHNHWPLDWSVELLHILKREIKERSTVPLQKSSEPVLHENEQHDGYL